jgi:hypothetical protein
MILQEITLIFFNGLGDFEGLRGLDNKSAGRGWRKNRQRQKL